MISHQTFYAPLGAIRVDRQSRHRQGQSLSLERVSELAQSILQHGLFHDILLELHEGPPAYLTLVAGEHRLEAFRLLAEAKAPCPNPDYQGWTHIPYHLCVQPTRGELLSIELEENLKRTPMEWKDEVRALARIHELQLELNPAHTATDLATMIGLSPQHTARCLRVAQALALGDERIMAAPGLAAANNILERQWDRAIAQEMDLLEGLEGAGFVRAESPVEGAIALQGQAPVGTIGNCRADMIRIQVPAPAPPSVLCTDFHTWAAAYQGPRFNLIHCDFPYGIGHHQSDQGNAEGLGHEAYEDTGEIYWGLVHTLLQFRYKLFSPSAHLVFWLSSTHQAHQDLRLRLASAWPELQIWPSPLIWFKSDNKGILPDPNRGPRNVVETALFASLGDRKVVRAVSNCYAAPTQRELHPSAKPEGMLKHFFSMLVDEHTKLLDPTCGAGSALRAADSLGASSVLGLELNPDYAASAERELLRSRKVRALAKESGPEPRPMVGDLGSLGDLI